MSQEKFARLDHQLVHSNPYWRHKHDRYRMPNGEEADYHYIETNHSVMVIPKLADGRFALVRQYRYLQRKYGLEFPGGGCHPDETRLESAKKELKEETGYAAQKWTFLGQFSPCLGLVDEYCDVFLAEDLEPGELQLESSEDIELKIISLENIHAAIKDGHLWSGMSQAAWLFYTLHP